jgi:4-hydroxybenzoate polyprenyltransferase
MASTIYILNDIVDLSDDRQHPSKRKRAIASGEISAQIAFVIALVLGFLSIFIASFINFYFFVCISSYFILNLIYSGFLKKLKCLDILVLSFFYILRLFFLVRISE